MLDLGAEVKVVDASRVRPHLFGRKLTDYRSLCNNHGVAPDYSDVDLQFEPQKLRGIVRNADVVFHLAAYFGGRGFVEEQQTECSAMFAVDQNVFRICLDEGVARIHYASSACVYPNELQRDKSYLLKEADAGPMRGWDSADQIYGWAKLLGEKQLQVMHMERGMSCSTCRFLTVYGPREYDDSHAIAALITRSIRKEDPFIVWGDGNQERGFTFVSDVVDGIIRATELVKDGTPLNLGVDWRLSIRKVVEIIHNILGFRPSTIRFDKSKPVGPHSRALDISKTKSLLGWEPKVQMEDGLQRTVQWHLANKVPAI